MSTKRKFNFSTSARIEQLKQIQLKKKTEAKVKWAVSAYNDWRNNRLYNFQYDVGIYYADLNNLETLEKNNLQHALCHFLPEVTKVKGDGMYPGSTLYQMVVAIQKYLNINKINWKLIDDVEFSDLKIVLDNLMKERTALNVGVTKKQAQVISYKDEQNLWESGVLGEDAPDKLRNTVLFLLGINIFLRAVEEHYYLRRSVAEGTSQLSFELNTRGEKCLVYREDSITKTHDGGLNDMRRERKIVWVFPSENRSRCPVRLVEKYLSLCPKNYKKRDNFYLQSLARPTPKQWYGCQVVGTNSIGKVVKVLMEKAHIEGFFTNHSLRRTGGTRLFQAGVDRKIVKEATGHRSDAVDAYQITSEKQREKVSKIISNQPLETSKLEKKVEPTNKTETETTKVSSNDMKVCTCGLNVTNIGDIVTSIVNKSSKEKKTVIKFQIEINHE